MRTWILIGILKHGSHLSAHIHVQWMHLIQDYYSIILQSRSCKSYSFYGKFSSMLKMNRILNFAWRFLYNSIVGKGINLPKYGDVVTILLNEIKHLLKKVTSIEASTKKLTNKSVGWVKFKWQHIHTLEASS